MLFRSAAVIVEPMAGSTGVLPPPKGYLKKLREICDKHGILLIFDEVITGFGRLGAAFAAERFGVIPDILTFAKGVTSGTVPMGGCMVRQGHGAHNMALVRHFAFNCLKQVKDKRSMKTRRKRASYDPAYMLSVIQPNAR